MRTLSTASRIGIACTFCASVWVSSGCSDPGGDSAVGDARVVSVDSNVDITFNVDMREDFSTEDSGLSGPDVLEDPAEQDQGEDLAGDSPLDSPTEDAPLDAADTGNDTTDGGAADSNDGGGPVDLGDTFDGGGPTDIGDTSDGGGPTDIGDTSDGGGPTDTGDLSDGGGPTDATDTTDSTDVAVEPDIPGAGEIAIYLTGDLTPVVFEDGAAGQTPRDYHVGVSAYRMIRPEGSGSSGSIPCFEYEDTLVADLYEDTLMGSCLTSEIPTATYTHGLVRVEWVTYTIDGTIHTADDVYPGEFEFFRAMSDTEYEGEGYTGGEGYLQFTGAFSYRFPVYGTSLSDGGGIEFQWDDENRDMWMKFPFNRPLPIESGSPEAHWARFHWEIYESFRWIDQVRDNYKKNVWDVRSYLISPSTEQVVGSGFNGYHITTSLD